MLELLAVNKDININCINPLSKRTPLMQICKFQTGKEFLTLFDAIFQWEDLNVTSQDSQGNSAIHFLCIFNNKNVTLDVINLFFQRDGLVASLKDRVGYNALHCLLSSGWSDCEGLAAIIRSFIDSDAKFDIHATTPDGHSILTLLCLFCGGEKLLETIRFLVVDLKMNVHLKTEYNGSNVLHLLAQNCSLTSAKQFVDALQLLIECGVDVGAVDEDGETVLTLLGRFSEIANLSDAFRFLVNDLKLNPNHQNED